MSCPYNSEVRYIRFLVEVTYNDQKITKGGKKYATN